MTDIQGESMVKHLECDEVLQLRATVEEKVNVISRQSQEIASLKSELKAVLSERDMLLCEVSRLKFEMEMSDLKRLHEGRYVFVPANLFWQQWLLQPCLSAVIPFLKNTKYRVICSKIFDS